MHTWEFSDSFKKSDYCFNKSSAKADALKSRLTIVSREAKEEVLVTL